MRGNKKTINNHRKKKRFREVIEERKAHASLRVIEGQGRWILRGKGACRRYGRGEGSPIKRGDLVGVKKYQSMEGREKGKKTPWAPSGVVKEGGWHLKKKLRSRRKARETGPGPNGGKG